MLGGCPLWPDEGASSPFELIENGGSNGGSHPEARLGAASQFERRDREEGAVQSVAEQIANTEDIPGLRDIP